MSLTPRTSLLLHSHELRHKLRPPVSEFLGGQISLMCPEKTGESTYSTSGSHKAGEPLGLGHVRNQVTYTQVAEPVPKVHNYVTDCGENGVGGITKGVVSSCSVKLYQAVYKWVLVDTRSGKRPATLTSPQIEVRTEDLQGSDRPRPPPHPTPCICSHWHYSVPPNSLVFSILVKNIPPGR